MAGAWAVIATFHLNGSPCGASCMRWTNSMAATARLPCNTDETSQPIAVYLLWSLKEKDESLVTAG